MSGPQGRLIVEALRQQVEIERLTRELDASRTLAAAEYADAERLRAALDSTRGAVLTVAQYDSWASEWLAKHPALA